jgi:hypothetical protein
LRLSALPNRPSPSRLKAILGWENPLSANPMLMTLGRPQQPASDLRDRSVGRLPLITTNAH